MSEKKGKYSKEEKLELLCLIDELGSLAAVEKTVGVARATLRKWGEELSADIVQYKSLRKKDPKEPLQLARSIEAQTLCTNATFLAEANRIKRDALTKLETLITTSKNLRDVCLAVELLDTITKETKVDEPEEKSNVYQQILNLQINNYDKAGDKGNIQKF